MTTTKKISTPSTTSPADASVAPVPPATPPPAPPPPDPNAALAALVQQSVAQLDTIGASLEGGDPMLTGTQKRHAARMRKGGVPILGIIADLATRHGLVPPAMSTATMMAQAGTASTLQPLANGLAALTKRVDDLIFSAQSGAWEQGMQFYALLQRRGSSDPTLATALQPVTQFLAYRHPKAKAPGTPTKTQKKATKKAVTTLKKTAPQLLAPPTPAQPPAVEPPAPPTPSPAAPAAPSAPKA